MREMENVVDSELGRKWKYWQGNGSTVGEHVPMPLYLP
jgi:hypothetical protein